MRHVPLLLAALTGCGGGRAPDVAYRGALVWLADRPHPELRGYVDECIAFLGRDDLPVYVEIKATRAEVEHVCEMDSIAGCRLGASQMVVVEDAADLHATALCREAGHALGYGDAQHKGDFWRRLDAAGLGGHAR